MKRYLAILLAALLWCTPLAAQDWPSRTVTIIVPFIAGSTPDSLARIVAESLQQRLVAAVRHREPAGRQRQHRHGGGGQGGAGRAHAGGEHRRAAGDQPLLFAKMPYETAKDIAPITILASQPSVLALAPNVAADSVESLLAAIKREPDKFTYGSIGRGSLSHLAMASLAMKAGVTVVHLPFPGSPAAVTALLRGDVQMAVLPAASVAPQAGPGKLKLLAVTSPQRSALLPSLPTLREAGIAGVEADAWVGLIAPAGTSEAVLARIHKAVVATLAEPALVEKLKAQFMVPIANSPDEFRAVLKEEHDRWAPIIAAGGIKVE